MRDVAVVVEHGTPFLFPDAEDSIRKMKSFVSNGDYTVSVTNLLPCYSILPACLFYLT